MGVRARQTMTAYADLNNAVSQFDELYRELS